MRVRLLPFFMFLSVVLFAQEGEWTGFLMEHGQKYPMSVEFKKEGKQLIGYTRVVVQDSVYGGKIYGRLYQDRSMNLWDHTEEDIVYPDSLPAMMSRRYQLMYRRSAFGDTMEGYWQEVQIRPKESLRKGKIELTRKSDASKA